MTLQYTHNNDFIRIPNEKMEITMMASVSRCEDALGRLSSFIAIQSFMTFIIFILETLMLIVEQMTRATDWRRWRPSGNSGSDRSRER